MSDEQVFFQRWASTTPGPELAKTLAATDRSAYPSADLYRMSAAKARQCAYDEAQLLSTIQGDTHTTRAESLKADAVNESRQAARPGRVRELNGLSVDKLASTMNWERSFARDWVLLAIDLIERIPVVFAALHEGRIDLERARAFSYALADLDTATARVVAERLLGNGERWHYGVMRRSAPNPDRVPRDKDEA